MRVFSMSLSLLIVGFSGAVSESDFEDIPVLSDRWFDVLENSPYHLQHSRIAEEHYEMCERASDRIGKFLRPEDIETVCRLRCQMYKSYCMAMKKSSTTKYQDVAKKYFENLFEGKKVMDEVELDRNIVTEAWALLRQTSPIMFSLFPLVLNQWKQMSLGGAILSWTIQLLSGLFLSCTWTQLVFNCYMTLACLVSEPGRSPLGEAFGPYVWMMTITISAFLLNDYMEIVFCLLGLGFFVWVVKTAFVVKRGVAATGIPLMLIHCVLMMEQIEYLRQRLMMKSLSVEILDLVLKAIVPYGSSGMWINNAADVARSAVRYFPFIEGVDRLKAFIGLMMIQFILFIAFRAMLGMSVMAAMRYKFSVRNISYGLMIYMSDIHGGVGYLFAWMMNTERAATRRFMYALLNIGLGLYEIMYAREFFMFRIVVSVFDNIVWSTSYSSSTKYLDLDIDFGGVSFPQNGAPSWVSLEQLQKLATFVVSVKAKDSKNNAWKGCGILRSRTNRPTELLTVNHVADCVEFTVNDVKVHGAPRNKIGESFDPVVSVDISEGVEGGKFDFLGREDYNSVTQLHFVGIADDGKKMITSIPQFEFDWRMNEVKASVNLKKGDSGAPVFASLGNGDLRYAGCVSSGNRDMKAGNRISLVTKRHSDRVKENRSVRFDSDSEGDASTDADVRRFNENRSFEHIGAQLIEKVTGKCETLGKWVVNQSDVKGWKYNPEDDAWDDGADTDDGKELDKATRKKKKRIVKRIAQEHEKMVEDIIDLISFAFNDEDDLDLVSDLIRKGKIPSHFDGRILVMRTGESVGKSKTE